MQICNSATCKADVVVTTSNGSILPSQVVSDSIRNIATLYFPVTIEALATTTFFVSQHSAVGTAAAPGEPHTETDQPSHESGVAFNITNGDLVLQFSAAGRLAAVTDTHTGVTSDLAVDYLHYTERLPPPVGNIFTGEYANA